MSDIFPDTPSFPIRSPRRKEAAPTSAIESLLDRHSPVGYVQDWETALGRDKEDHRPVPHSAIVIFNLGGEHLALSSLVIGQMTTMRRLHRIPHMRNPVIRGVVNINGRLRLFVSLGALLEIGESFVFYENSEKIDDVPMITIEQNGEVWTFAVDKILGVFRCELNQMKNVPVTVAKSTANYVKGILNWRDQQVALLDEELLFFSLRRSL